MAPHSSTLAWKIPWTEEPVRPQSMGSLWRRQWHPTPVFLPGKSHGWMSLVGCSPWGHFHFSLSCIGEGNGNPLQCFCLENPRDGGAWWAAICGVTQSRTRLKWLSKSKSNISFLPLLIDSLYPQEAYYLVWEISTYEKLVTQVKFTSCQVSCLLLLLLSCISRVWLCVTPQMAAHQAPSSLRFSRQVHWSGLPFHSQMHKSEKWKWSCSVMSDSSRPHGL